MTYSDQNIDAVVFGNKCPVCLGMMLPITVKDQPGFRICKDCRHLSWEKLPSVNEIDEYYTSRYTVDHAQKQIQASNRRYYRDHLAELAKRSLVATPSLLDYGSSWPVLLEEAKLSRLFGKVVGVECDLEAINQAGSIGITMYTPLQFMDTIPDRFFDIVRFSHVLEHMIDPVEVLKGVILKMKRNALVYITQPTFPAFKINSELPTIKDAVYPEHLHFFSPVSLAKMILSCGLIIEELAAHTREDEVKKIYYDHIDQDFVVDKMSEFSTCTPSYFKKLGGFPTYIGDNIHCIARVS